MTEPVLPLVQTTQLLRDVARGLPAPRSAGYVPLRRGVWASAGVDPGHPDVRIAAVAAQLPEHAAIGGWAAARLHEASIARDCLEVFDGSREWDPRGRSVGARVLVLAGRHSRMRARQDVLLLRSPAAETERVHLPGVVVSTPVRTAFDLARLLPREQAVVGLDRLGHLGLLRAEDIAQLLRARPLRSGCPAAWSALAAMDPRSESPQETRLRLLWVWSGLPVPASNPVVRDHRGEFVARVDLLDPVAGVVGEYDGAAHATADRRGRDASRHETLESLGLIVVRATSVDLMGVRARDALASRLRAAYRRAAGRPRGARRWVVDETSVVDDAR